MSAHRIDNHRRDSGALPIVRFHERIHPLLMSARNGAPLDLAGDENLADALRRREHPFNEDVLPSHAKLLEPREFYGAAKVDHPTGDGKRAQRKQAALPGTSALLPHVAA